MEKKLKREEESSSETQKTYSLIRSASACSNFVRVMLRVIELANRKDSEQRQHNVIVNMSFGSF